MLCGRTEWGVVDRAFDAEEFYYNIVELFELDPEDEWVVETLDWLDRCVSYDCCRCGATNNVPVRYLTVAPAVLKT